VRAASLLATLVLVLVAPAQTNGQTQLAFPALTGRVVDQANILSAETERAISDASAKFEQATSNQLVVVALASLHGQTIEDYGYQLGRQWGIGRAGKNNGVLMIVAPAERTVRIEVGYGLEGTLTDAAARGIIEQRIIPRFRDGDYDGGVRDGVDTIIAVLSGDAQTAARMQEAGSRRIRSPGTSDVSTFLIVAIFVLFFIVPRMMGSRRRRGFYYGELGGLGGGMLGGRRGGGFGGGGFRGGGGSFGGGGASGRW
jgi:uncharacterized protein